MRKGLKGDNAHSGRKRIKNEIKSSFASTKKPKKCAWKHRFVCLAMYGPEKLYEAGLGEKVVEFPSLDASFCTQCSLSSEVGVGLSYVGACQTLEDWRHCLQLPSLLLPHCGVSSMICQ